MFVNKDKICWNSCIKCDEYIPFIHKYEPVTELSRQPFTKVVGMIENKEHNKLECHNSGVLAVNLIIECINEVCILNIPICRTLAQEANP